MEAGSGEEVWVAAILRALASACYSRRIDICVPAPFLGLVHSRIRVFQERLNIAPIIRVDGNPYAGGTVYTNPADPEGL